MAFSLHPQLARDTRSLGQLDLSEVLLMNDARFPWLILVPRLPDLRDIHQLPEPHSSRLWEEIRAASVALETVTGAFKMNVAALGNMVPQLHVHIIARFEGDAAWPGPVWGVGEPQPYTTDASDQLSASIAGALSL